MDVDRHHQTSGGPHVTSIISQAYLPRWVPYSDLTRDPTSALHKIADCSITAITQPPGSARSAYSLGYFPPSPCTRHSDPWSSVASLSLEMPPKSQRPPSSSKRAPSTPAPKELAVTDLSWEVTCPTSPLATQLAIRSH